MLRLAGFTMYELLLQMRIRCNRWTEGLVTWIMKFTKAQSSGNPSSQTQVPRSSTPLANSFLTLWPASFKILNQAGQKVHVLTTMKLGKKIAAEKVIILPESPITRRRDVNKLTQEQMPSFDRQT
jgi:hypothetical protein